MSNGLSLGSNTSLEDAVDLDARPAPPISRGEAFEASLMQSFANTPDFAIIRGIRNKTLENWNYESGGNDILSPEQLNSQLQPEKPFDSSMTLEQGREAIDRQYLEKHLNDIIDRGPQDAWTKITNFIGMGVGQLTPVNIGLGVAVGAVRAGLVARAALPKFLSGAIELEEATRRSVPLASATQRAAVLTGENVVGNLIADVPTQAARSNAELEFNPMEMVANAFAGAIIGGGIRVGQQEFSLKFNPKWRDLPVMGKQKVQEVALLQTEMDKHIDVEDTITIYSAPDPDVTKEFVAPSTPGQMPDIRGVGTVPEIRGVGTVPSLNPSEVKQNFKKSIFDTPYEETALIDARVKDVVYSKDAVEIRKEIDDGIKELRSMDTLGHLDEEGKTFIVESADIDSRVATIEKAFDLAEPCKRPHI